MNPYETLHPCLHLGTTLLVLVTTLCKSVLASREFVGGGCKVVQACIVLACSKVVGGGCKVVESRINISGATLCTVSILRL